MGEDQVKDSNTSLEVAPHVNSNVFCLNIQHPAKAFATVVPQHADIPLVMMCVLSSHHSVGLSTFLITIYNVCMSMPVWGVHP